MKKIKTHIHAKTIPENHISHKKKNTYTICFSSLMPLHAFQLYRETPLAVIKKNGQQTQEITDWLTCTMFPNPTANEMGTIYDYRQLSWKSGTSTCPVSSIIPFAFPINPTTFSQGSNKKSHSLHITQSLQALHTLLTEI